MHACTPGSPMHPQPTTPHHSTSPTPPQHPNSQRTEGQASNKHTEGSHAGIQNASEDSSGKTGNIAHSGWRRSAADKAAGAAAGAAVAAREVCRVAVGPPPAGGDGERVRVAERGFGGPLLRLPEELRVRWVVSV